MCLIQIGSGSAGYDANIQDGFSNYITSKNIQKKVFIIEANSIHINNLTKFYEKHKNVEIFNLAIIPDVINFKIMDFFYCVEDFPNYQIFSNSKSFVKKHFPNGKIEKKSVECLRISEFFDKNNINEIDYLSTDIEGMDYSLLINLDLKKFKIENISFEHLHLSFWQKIKIVSKFVNNGYFFSGMGFDLRKSDWMFTKDYRYKKLQTFFLPFTPRRIWKRYEFSTLK